MRSAAFCRGDGDGYLRCGGQLGFAIVHINDCGALCIAGLRPGRRHRHLQGILGVVHARPQGGIPWDVEWRWLVLIHRVGGRI